MNGPVKCDKFAVLQLPYQRLPSIYSCKKGHILRDTDRDVFPLCHLNTFFKDIILKLLSSSLLIFKLNSRQTLISDHGGSFHTHNRSSISHLNEGNSTANHSMDTVGFLTPKNQNEGTLCCRPPTWGDKCRDCAVTMLCLLYCHWILPMNLGNFLETLASAKLLWPLAFLGSMLSFF